jgi:hypothetical protein
MMKPIQYFWTVTRPPASVFVAAVLLFLYATFLAANSPGEFGEILGLTLAGQALVASTGYRERLVRGHFDPILAGRRSRIGVALAHAALSIVPGLTFWLAIGLLEHSIHLRHPLAFAAGPVAALLYVSAVVWTVSLVLGPNTGGVLWMAVLLTLAAAQRIHLLSEAYGTSRPGLSVSFAAAKAALIWPLLMFTNGGSVEPAVLVLILVAAVATFLGGLGIIVRLDAPLKDPS